MKVKIRIGNELMFCSTVMCCLISYIFFLKLLDGMFYFLLLLGTQQYNNNIDDLTLQLRFTNSK